MPCKMPALTHRATSRTWAHGAEANLCLLPVFARMTPAVLICISLITHMFISHLSFLSPGLPVTPLPLSHGAVSLWAISVILPGALDKVSLEGGSPPPFPFNPTGPLHRPREKGSLVPKFPRDLGTKRRQHCGFSSNKRRWTQDKSLGQGPRVWSYSVWQAMPSDPPGDSEVSAYKW